MLISQWSHSIARWIMCTVRELRPLLADPERRAAAMLSQEQGERLWERTKAQNRARDMAEKRELRDMLSKYNPWGRPGGGAPNPQGIRMHNLRFEEILPKPQQKAQTYEWKPRHYNGGVKGGGGAPLVTNSGRIITTYREDPNLRFQFNSPMRDVVDKDLRYKMAPNEKTDYKRQLDALVAERKLRKEKENKRNLLHEKALGWSDPQSLKKYQQPPPSTNTAKPPQHQQQCGQQGDENKNKVVVPHAKNTDHKEGSAEAVRSEVRHTCGLDDVKQPPANGGGGGDRGSSNNGVELVPLLAKRRQKKIPLGTTDVTNYQNEADQKWRDMGIQYLDDLRRQMSWKNKEQKLKKQREETQCRQHYDTWSNFWGRPGHGAPTGTNNKMLDLHALLYAVG